MDGEWGVHIYLCMQPVSALSSHLSAPCLYLSPLLLLADSSFCRYFLLGAIFIAVFNSYLQSYLKKRQINGVHQHAMISACHTVIAAMLTGVDFSVCKFVSL